MNKQYNLKLDLQFRCNNSIITFSEFDNNTSDFFMRITNGGKLVDIEKAIVVLATIKPSGKVSSQFVEVENGLVYADLKANMIDEIGTYTAQAMLILEDERVVTDTINYEVKEDKIFSLLNDSVEATEEFTLLTNMLSRLSTIEISEEQRMINEAERILSEENRKIEEAKRVEAELVRQHEEADRAKYDATRESNENIRKQNESIRLANETNRIDEEAKRVEEENKRKLAEEERNANYNFMTEDEERRRSEANAHKEAEVLRVQAETNRVNEEAKRRTTEQARVSAENTRVSNENTREANEVTRKNNETQRVEAETQRQNRYNSFITDAEANANNFENYTNTAKVKEEERKSNELDRKSQETKRVSNEVERISNENTRKANEVAREKNETSRQYVFENKVDEFDEKIVELNTTKDNFISSINTKVDNKISELDTAKSDMTNTVSNKVNEVETRFNALTSSQQQDAEVIDARDGETSLKARLDRDIEKAKQVYAPVEGSYISTDSSSGYLKDVEILGNTVQDASNLADIRSVGDTVEGQELYEIPVVSVGKNLLNSKMELGTISGGLNNTSSTNQIRTVDFVRLKPNTDYVISGIPNYTVIFCTKNFGYITEVGRQGGTKFTTPENCEYIKFRTYSSDNITNINTNIQLEKGTVATPYEPYVEDKLTILSPVQLEKVGDVRDRIICKDGVWGVEKNVETIVLDGSENWIYSKTKENTCEVKVTNPIQNIKLPGNNSLILQCICNLAKPTNANTSWNTDITGISYNPTDNTFRLSILKTQLTTLDDVGVKAFITRNNLMIKYQVLTPTFIPLPHDQQVKLRTFANKTNISFLTEIEGTIKAQVPKSLGATVNTHTEQISNLNKELDRVKKLEESTVSTVETESDFTTVEATNNGYFEDVKLEGKTLVVNANNEVVEPRTEGTTLKSVGDGADEIVVSSVKGDGNLFNKTLYYNLATKFDVDKDGYKVKNIKLKPNTEYTIHSTNNVNGLILISKNKQVNSGWFYDFRKSTINPTQFTTDSTGFIYIGCYGVEDSKLNEILDNSTIQIEEGTVATPYKSYVGDKKRLLFYNNETQIWEKPILREWDSIEKHSDGKYYYHQRSGEVVLNGSENWINPSWTENDTIAFSYPLQVKPNGTIAICDKFNVISNGLSTQTIECCQIASNTSIAIRILKSKLSTQDTQGFKTWLQANNVTVVYQLAQEKVYECTNIDLITYANETNYIVESGAITPKSILKVHNNISNVVSLLQKKVSLLESNITSYMITQNRLMLASRYNADTVSFKVDVASLRDTFEYDNDLYELILNNILAGKDNYNREYIENLIIFYWMDFALSDEMYSTLFEIIEEQHNPKVIEDEAPLI